MEFLKTVLGDQYVTFEAAVKAYNEDPANKDNQVKLGNLATGDYVSKDKYTALETANTGLQEQLKTATDTLKSFDGVDVKDLQGKITTLSTDLDTQKSTYEKKIADMEFDSTIAEAVKQAGGRSAKAVMAELDMDALRASKNQGADIETAVNACKDANAWMFGTNEPINNPVGPTGGGDPAVADSNTIALRAAMGLAAEETK